MCTLNHSPCTGERVRGFLLNIADDVIDGNAGSIPLIPALVLKTLSEFGFEYLAVIVFRQAVDKAVRLGPFEACNIVQAKPVQVFCFHYRVWCRYDEGNDLFAPLGMGPRPTTETSSTSSWRKRTSSTSRG